MDEALVTLESNPSNSRAESVSMARGGEVSSELLRLLVCPLTKGPLTYHPSEQELWSADAGLAYPIRDGIPILLVEEARKIAADE